MRALALLGCFAALALPAASAAAPAPKLADPTAAARPLVIRFFVLVSSLMAREERTAPVPGAEVPCAVVGQ